MKSKALPLFAAVSGLGILGCTAIPQAGLIYSSTNVVGVAMKVSTADATAPVDLSIGYKSHDFAYVPVAVAAGKAGDVSGIEKVWASHSRTSGQSARCMTASNSVGTKALAARTTQEQRELDEACDSKRDAMSVYGQFDTTTKLSGNDRSAGLVVGKVFSTGVAAQNVSEAASRVAHTDCIRAITALFPATAKPEDVLAATKANCPLN